jgi:hypothetical protein
MLQSTKMLRETYSFAAAESKAHAALFPSMLISRQRWRRHAEVCYHKSAVV